MKDACLIDYKLHVLSLSLSLSLILKYENKNLYHK